MSLVKPVSKITFVTLPSPLASLTLEPIQDPFLQSMLAVAAHPEIGAWQKVQPRHELRRSYKTLREFFTKSTNKDTWLDARMQAIQNAGLCTLVAMLEETIFWLQEITYHGDLPLAPAEDILLACAMSLSKVILTKLKELAPCFLPNTRDYNFVKQLFYITCATARQNKVVETLSSSYVKQPLCLLAAYAAVAPAYINANCRRRHDEVEFLGHYIKNYNPGTLSSLLTEAVETHTRDCRSASCSRLVRAILSPGTGSLGLFFVPGLNQ